MGRPLLATTISALTLALGACGGSDDNGVATTPASRLLKPSQAERFPAGSPRRLLMDYWGALQYRAWAQALGYYDPGLVKFVGADKIVGTFQARSSFFQLNAPDPVRERRRGVVRTVYYRLPQTPGKLESMSWRRAGPDLRIVYDSSLDEALRGQAILDVDGPDKEKPSARATRAGERAATLQARFLQHERLPAG